MTPPGRTDGQPLWSVVTRAVALDAIAVLPVGLAGTLAILIVRDNGAPRTLGGLMVGAYFISGALCALASGRVDRLGWQSAASAGLGLTGLGLALPVCTATPHYLVASSALAGAGGALVQPATSAFLSQVVAPDMRPLAINIKFASAPGAMLIAGAAVPALAQFAGWRATFLVACAAPLVGLVLIWTIRPHRASLSGGMMEVGATPLSALWPVGLAVMLGSILGGTLVAFTVPSLVHVGYSPTAAGSLFALFSALAVGVRIVIGVLANRPSMHNFRAVAVMMVIGATGGLLLVLPHPLPLVLGAALAFSMGFGWIGQAFALVVGMYQHTPAAATAVVQSGGMAGSALGPCMGAVLVSHFGLASAWVAAAGASFCGAVLLWQVVGRSRLPRVHAERLEQRPG